MDSIRRRECIHINRGKAVELYIEYDKSASKVVRELGYTTRKTHKRWYKEYYETGELHKKHRRCYSSEQKANAIQYYLDHQRNLSRTVRDLGYPCRIILGKWVHKYLPQQYLPINSTVAVVQYTYKQKNRRCCVTRIRGKDFKADSARDQRSPWYPLEVEASIAWGGK